MLSDQHLFGRIDILIDQISGYLCKENTDENIEILVSPAYAGRAWVKWSKLHSFEACTYNMRENSDDGDHCARIVRKDTALWDLLRDQTAYHDGSLSAGTGADSYGGVQHCGGRIRVNNKNMKERYCS